MSMKMAKFIDHTLLKPNAGKQDIQTLCEEALQHQFYSVCVSSSWVSYCYDQLRDSDVRISAVCGFPLGINASEVKAYEAAHCVENGAAEIDMVLSVGKLLDGELGTVEEDIKKVVNIVHSAAIVKVILETGFLNEQQIREACKCAEQAGAHFVKTSTGFGPRGASIEDIQIMKSAVSDRMGIKASGGIRDLETAQQMIASGATRLGTSSGISIIQGLAGSDEY